MGSVQIVINDGRDDLVIPYFILFSCAVSNHCETICMQRMQSIKMCAARTVLISDGVILTQVDLKVFGHQECCKESILFSLLSEGAS